MSVILSPEIEQALADLRQAIIKQLQRQQISVADAPASPTIAGDSLIAPAQSSTEPAPAVVLPSAINNSQVDTVYQSPGGNNALSDDPATSLPYPEMPSAVSQVSQENQSLPPNQAQTNMPVPQMPVPDLSSANQVMPEQIGDIPNSSPPVFPQSPAGMSNNVGAQSVEFVPNPDQLIMPNVSEPAEIAPNPQSASFAKARGLLSSVLQKHHP